MKNIFIFIITASLTISCNKKTAKQNLTFVNGYWEISKVQIKEGNDKEYNFNQSIDFFEIKGDSIGFRKKLYPQYNGRFTSQGSKTGIPFTILENNNNVNFNYKNGTKKWTEALISVKENEMITKNENGNTYFYKRYEKIKL